MLLVAIAWMLSQRKTIDLNIARKWLSVKRKVDFNKVWIVLFLGAFLLHFSAGAVYREIYPDKIAAREQHLISAAQYLGAPQNAIKTQEEMKRRQFERFCFVTYQYAPDVKIIYYLDKLKEQGYEIVKAGQKEIRAKKSELIVTISFDGERIHQTFEFDDIFQRFAL